MKFVGVTVSSLAALAAMSLAASAADLGSIKDDDEAPPPPSVSWTGIYITGGLGGSYMFTDMVGEVDAFLEEEGDEGIGVGALGNSGAANFFGSVGAGIDFQVSPRWVIGIVGDYDFGSSQDASVSGGGFVDPSLGEAVVTVSAEMGDTWSIGGRIGHLINPRTLVYALGGYSEAEISLTGSLEGDVQFEDFGPYTVTSGKSWRQGYFVGGGLETMLMENISAKLEYRYAKYDGDEFEVEDTFSVDGLDGEIVGGASMSDPEVHTVRAALSVRFNAFGH